MSGAGVPTLQADQLNIIAHHLTAIQTGQEFWEDKTPDSWSLNLDSKECTNEAIKISKLKRTQVQKQAD